MEEQKATDLLEANKIRKNSHLDGIWNELGVRGDNEKLDRILKREKRTVFYFIDMVLFTALFGLIIYVHLLGWFDKSVFVIDCKNGDVVSVDGIPQQGKTLGDYGYTASAGAEGIEIRNPKGVLVAG